MDPREVLNRGQTAAQEGRHRQALRDFIWFHENALKYRPSLYGVRLSFALGYWMDLGQVYPPALEALQSVKRRGETALLGGQGNRHLFHDIVSINRELGRTNETYELFVKIGKKYPELAKECGYLAVQAIVDARNFKLASEQLPHPENYLLWCSDQLNEDFKRKGATPRITKMQRETFVKIYCCNVQTALKILKGLRNFSAAEAALEWAIALVGPKRARDLVVLQLISNE